MARVAVVGTGYVGLTTGACLSHLGHQVVCADVDESKVEMLNSGEIPIVEADLDTLVDAGLKSGQLRFMVTARKAILESQPEFVFLCLPTPQGEDGSADLSYVLGAAEEISDALVPGSVVINKSTCPVGTTEQVARVIARSDISVASNPEFLREGTAVRDSLNPDRIVVGASDHDIARRVAELFASLRTQVLLTDPASAELMKYASNAFLATKLSFVNVIAHLCEQFGADVMDVVAGMGLDKRIGSEFLQPGPGWGGSCFPKDTKALLSIAKDVGCEFPMLKATMDENVEQRRRIASRAIRMAESTTSGRKPRIAVWGLTYKAGTDDLRESPAIAIIEEMVRAGAKVTAYDPTVESELPGIESVSIAPDMYAAVEGADVLVVLTEWPDFRNAHLAKVAGLMANPQILDARNVIDLRDAEMNGFSYQGVGRQL